MAKRRTPESEHERLSVMREYERKYAAAGLIGGVDEAGRGPLAGPVVAACVILPPDCDIFYLDDSKKVTERRRELLYDEICEKAVSYGIGMVGPEVIDEINILQATYRAMQEAIAQMEPAPQLLLNDAVTIPGVDIPQIPLIHGDALSVSIAAASILAKVTRDRYMRAADSIYPEYGFAGHKGYGTKAHSEAILTYGPCPLHRRTFLRKPLGESNG
ncbi:MAG: ribonuclease HII [Lachnospiraceae bacterium]|nr:ribonuclease HII [Lachnospiraceae bacterium]